MEGKKLWLNPALPIEDRISELLGEMTIEEKLGQMMTTDGEMDDPKEDIMKYHMGSFFYVMGDRAKYAIDAARLTRLKIPLLLGIDSIHGYSYWSGSTIFPSQLGLSCSWSTQCAENMGSVTAKEMQYTGPCWTFSPVLGVVRDIRWGRCDETFGEDPFLVGELGAGIVKGYQGPTVIYIIYIYIYIYTPHHTTHYLRQ